MSKQDRQGARTPAQLEQEYKFGERFAKAFGLAEDASKKADEAKAAANALDKKLTQEEIFNRLTKNGEVEGIYRDEAGNVYINASYMVSGILRSKDGSTFYLDLDNGILKGKFEELSISGKEVVTGDVLEEYAQNVAESIDHLQQQIDGQIQSWFYDYVPTVSNYPASEWTTEALKIEHLGDLFYIVDSEESGGLTYRWAMVGDSYQWVLVEDSDVAKALAQAAKAQDTADGKRRVFVVQPVPPYDVGDLWTDGADLKVCQTARTSGSYYASDWKLATDYIDSGTAEEIAKDKVDAQTQADIFNKLTNNGELQGVYMKDGQLYINASYLATGILASKDGKTFYLDLDNGVLKGQFTEFSISGKSVDTIAQEKADAAEANAVTAAANDATSKANAAQNNAISEAAADATSKADAAQQNAQNYADGVGQNAINTAAGDATNKANTAEANAISAAEKDATQKANAAEANAQGYADAVGLSAVNTAANDATQKANAAEANAKIYADDVAFARVNAQTQEDIFNKLTNNGELKGIYMQDGELYINATYLMSGVIDAAVIEVINLIAKKVCSVLGNSEMRIDGAALRLFQNGQQLFGVSTEYDNYATLRLDQTAVGHSALEAGGERVQFVDLSGIIPKTLASFCIENGAGSLKTDLINGMTVEWKDNGNGTFTLIGR